MAGVDSRHRRQLFAAMFGLIATIFLIIHDVQLECVPPDSQGICIPRQVNEIARGIALRSSQQNQMYVHTPFQCMDQCYRQENCTGFTFEMNYTFTDGRKQQCVLFREEIEVRQANKTFCNAERCYFSYAKHVNIGNRILNSP